MEQDVVKATVLGAQAGQPQLIQLLFRQTRTHPGRREVRVKVTAVMMSNHGEALMAAARRGIGLAVAPSFMARRDLDAGLLEPVLLDWSLPEFGVFAVYPHRRFVSPKVRVLLEALMAHFGDGTRDPWWPEPLSQAVAMPTAHARAKQRTRVHESESAKRSSQRRLAECASRPFGTAGRKVPGTTAMRCGA